MQERIIQAPLQNEMDFLKPERVHK